MLLKDIIECVRPRELDGTWTSARYDFQRNLAIIVILEKHRETHDYRIAFDHFDDLVVFDRAQNPTKMKCVQIKVKDTGPWSISDFSTPDSKVRPRSIISKMYFSFDQIGFLVDELEFASNAYFIFQLTGGRKSGIDDQIVYASVLDNQARQTLNTALDADYMLPRVCLLEKTRFRYFSLPLVNQTQTVRGELQTFLEERVGGQFVPSSGLYKQLFAEVSQKSGVGNRYAGVDEFYRTKTLDGWSLERLFQEATSTVLVTEAWSEIAEQLKACVPKSGERILTRRYCLQYISDRATGGPRALKLRQLCNRALDTASYEDIMNFNGVVDCAEYLLEALPTDSEHQFTVMEQRAALIVHVLEAMHEGAERARLSTVNQQLSGAD